MAGSKGTPAFVPGVLTLALEVGAEPLRRAVVEDAFGHVESLGVVAGEAVVAHCRVDHEVTGFVARVRSGVGHAGRAVARRCGTQTETTSTFNET